MTAVALISGGLTAEDYEDRAAADPRIDALREKMKVKEDLRYSREYLEPDKRSIANAVQVFFKDGSSTERVEVEYPVGHRRRRAEGLPLLLKKARENLETRFPTSQVDRILQLFHDAGRWAFVRGGEFIERFLPFRPKG
jgi:2-methylcitrate dehydratase PrpD